MYKIILIHDQSPAPNLKRLIHDLVRETLREPTGALRSIKAHEVRPPNVEIEGNLRHPHFDTSVGEEVDYMKHSARLSIEFSLSNKFAASDNDTDIVSIKGPFNMMLSKGVPALAKILEKKMTQLHKGARNEALVRSALSADIGKTYLGITIGEAFYSSSKQDRKSKIDCQLTYSDTKGANKKVFRFGIKSSEGGVYRHINERLEQDVPQLAVVTDKDSPDVPYEWIVRAVCRMIVLRRHGYIAHFSLSTVDMRSNGPKISIIKMTKVS